MDQVRFYLSFQYSAIQKTILRHDRLWSIAGISALLSRFNEFDMLNIAQDRCHEGEVLLAGGGKFTASFPTESQALQARAKIIKLVATALPMLEYQVSEVIPAPSLKIAKGGNGSGPKLNGLLEGLKAQKRTFRGYGVTFNPYLERCSECAEYPAETGRDDQRYCRICDAAKQMPKAFDESSSSDAKSTIDRIYSDYLSGLPPGSNLAIPYDFSNLFPKHQGDSISSNTQVDRMAVWLSDTNNMKDKVILWGNQDDDHMVKKTFQSVKSLNAKIVTKALKDTFPNPEGEHLPFRLIVAGGDDLCLVMDEKYILRFSKNISAGLHEQVNSLGHDHPLQESNLKAARDKMIEEDAEMAKRLKEPKPYCFGASFIIASVHTPFRKIHEAGEHLMSQAKRLTNRDGNSIFWSIMPEMTQPLGDHFQSEGLFFHKPLFIDKPSRPAGSDSPTFVDYLEMADRCRKISRTHRHMIAQELANTHRKFEGDAKTSGWAMENWLKKMASSGLEKSFNPLLEEAGLRGSEEQGGQLLTNRMATLLELLSIKTIEKDGTKT